MRVVPTYCTLRAQPRKIFWDYDGVLVLVAARFIGKWGDGKGGESTFNIQNLRKEFRRYGLRTKDLVQIFLLQRLGVHNLTECRDAEEARRADAVFWFLRLFFQWESCEDRGRHFIGGQEVEECFVQGVRGGEECDMEGYVGDFVGNVFEEVWRETEEGVLEGGGEDDSVEGFFVC